MNLGTTHSIPLELQPLKTQDLRAEGALASRAKGRACLTPRNGLLSYCYQSNYTVPFVERSGGGGPGIVHKFNS